MSCSGELGVHVARYDEASAARPLARCLIADDHPLLRDSLAMLISTRWPAAIGRGRLTAVPIATHPARGWRAARGNSCVLSSPPSARRRRSQSPRSTMSQTEKIPARLLRRSLRLHCLRLLHQIID